MKYRVKLKEKVEYTIVVNADSAEIACDLAEAKVRDCEASGKETCYDLDVMYIQEIKDEKEDNRIINNAAT